MFLEIWKVSRWDKNRLSDGALKQGSNGDVSAVEERLPALVEIAKMVRSFHHMLRRKSKEDLDRPAARTFGSIIADRAWGQDTITQSA